MKRALAVGLLVGGMLAGCTLRSGPKTPEPSPTLPTPVITNVAAPDPEIGARLFLDAWKRDDLPAMYALLSPLSQDSLTEEEFVSFYQEVKQAAALASIDYQITSSLVNPREAQVSYRITLTSAVVGDVVRDTYLSLVREAGEWKVAWAPTTVLPELTQGTSLFMDVVTPTRANIYDRNGLALAVQADVVAVYIQPNLIGDEKAEETMLTVLGRLFDRSTGSIQALYESFRGTDYLIPLGEVALEDFQRIEGTLAAVGGTNWGTYSGRYYPLGEQSSQAVGYVAQITVEQADEYRQRGYAGDEFVGQTGLEFVFENELRGRPGGTLYVRDTSGQVLTPLASRDPGVPQAVTTTLDRNLQLEAQQALEGLRGAIVVLERNTGRVLAIASSPSFNPNLFNASNRNSSAGLTELGRRNDNPFLDRATDSAYPLGSVFKILTMAAALETKAFTPDSEYTCNGYFEELPGFTGHDWTVTKEIAPHGTLTLMQGLERSCNPWFWHIGLALFDRGFPTALPDMAKGFGLGQATGIEIGESQGLIPDPEWTLANLGREWSAGDSVQLAIGQASMGVTPAAGGALHRRRRQRRDALSAADRRDDPDRRRRGQPTVRRRRTGQDPGLGREPGVHPTGDDAGGARAERHGLPPLPWVEHRPGRQDRHGDQRGGDGVACLVRRLHIPQRAGEAGHRRRGVGREPGRRLGVGGANLPPRDRVVLLWTPLHALPLGVADRRVAHADARGRRRH